MPGKLPIEDLEQVLSRTADLWEAVRGQQLFISGGTGFFGQWLLESFAHANDQLHLHATASVLTRNANAFAKKAPHIVARSDIHLYSGDVRNFAFPSGEFQFVIHAATDASAKLNSENPLLMFDTIVEGARRMLDFTAQCRAKSFLLTSSGAVYGPQPPDLAATPEDFTGAPDPASPASAYGEGKRAAELLCHAYSRQHSFAVKIARCFAFVGPGLPLDSHFAIGNFIRDVLKSQPIGIQGDGTAIRSYLYASDLAVWLWKILFAGASGRAYNTGSSVAVSIGDLAQAVQRELGHKEHVSVAQNPVPGKALQRYVPNVNRAVTELGLREEIKLGEAIRKTAQWHKLQQE